MGKRGKNDSEEHKVGENNETYLVIRKGGYARGKLMAGEEGERREERKQPER